LALVENNLGQILKSSLSVTKALKDLELLPIEKQERLARIGISFESLNKLSKDLEDRKQNQLATPYVFISKEEIDQQKGLIDSLLKEKNYSDVESRIFKNAERQGLEIPAYNAFYHKRTGEYKENLELSYEYGDSSASVNISAFNKGHYFTKMTQNALILFKSILEEFIQEEINSDSAVISITGFADALIVGPNLIYKGEYENKIIDSFYNLNIKKYENANFEDKYPIITNERLAYLRAYHPKYEFSKSTLLKNFKYLLNTKVMSDTGANFRKVKIEIFIKNAYKLKLDRLTYYSKIQVKKLIENPKGKINLEQILTASTPTYTGQKYAIIFGISDYKNLDEIPSHSKFGLTDLKYAENDAYEFKRFLEQDKYSSGNWEISYFCGKQATRSNIYSKLDKVLALAGPKDLVYIFYSGHGIMSQTVEKEVLLLPYDFKEDYVASDAIIYSDIRDRIDKSKAQSIVFFVDACHSGSIGISNKKGVGNPVFDELLSKTSSFPNTKFIFASSSGGQASYEMKESKNGLFTYYLLKGLKGEAPNTIKNKFVDKSELYYFVREKVENYSKENMTYPQTPDIYGYSGTEMETFPLSIREK
jgi:hypothetical protein